MPASHLGNGLYFQFAEVPVNTFETVSQEALVEHLGFTCQGQQRG